MTAFAKPPGELGLAQSWLFVGMVVTAALFDRGCSQRMLSLLANHAGALQLIEDAAKMRGPHRGAAASDVFDQLIEDLYALAVSLLGPTS